MDENNKEKQMQRINKAMIQMQKDNKTLKDVFDDYEYLRKYLSDEDIVFFRNRIIEFENKYSEKLEKYIKENYVPPVEKDVTYANNKNIRVNKKEFNLEWQEITPYTILGIEEKEYTKEELLEIVGKKINFIKNHGIDKEEMQRDIDNILDAYNELTKQSSKKR